MTTDLRTPPRVGSSHGQPPPSVGEAAARAARLVLGLLLIGAGLALALWLWRDGTVQVEQTTLTHPAVDRVVLDLRANGDVEVAVHDADQIRVERRIEQTFREVEVTEEIVGDELRLSSSRCQRWISFPADRCFASFVLTVPASTSVVGEVGHGALVVAGLHGPVDLRTGHGSIEVADTAGEMNLRTGHGRIDAVDTDGALRLQSGHGRIAVTRARGDVTVETGHGAVSARDVSGSFVATTGNGSVGGGRAAGRRPARPGRGGRPAARTNRGRHHRRHDHAVDRARRHRPGCCGRADLGGGEHLARLDRRGPANRRPALRRHDRRVRANRRPRHRDRPERPPQARGDDRPRQHRDPLRRLTGAPTFAVAPAHALRVQRTASQEHAVDDPVDNPPRTWG
jgi:hypothetical protein